MCPDNQAPDAPSGLSYSGVTQSSFLLSWIAATDNKCVTEYEVIKNGKSVGITKRTFMKISGLECNNKFSITVRAFDAACNFSSSDSLLISTSACDQEISPN